MKRIINLLTILLPLTLLASSCIKREPFKTSAPECTAESTSLTCMGKRDREAAAKEKPPAGKQKLDLTPGDSCGGATRDTKVKPPPGWTCDDDGCGPSGGAKKKPQPKSETIMVPERKANPEKVKRQKILAECLEDEEPRADTSWIDEYERGTPRAEADKRSRLEQLRIYEERYDKCATTMSLYLTEHEKYSSDKGEWPSDSSFPDYLTDPKSVKSGLNRVAREYAWALYNVVQFRGQLPGYDFACEQDCRALTRYELVGKLASFMKYYNLTPAEVWKDGTGQDLRSAAEVGYQELYKVWALANTTAAARKELRYRLCADLPKAGNLKPLMTVELDTLDCENKRTKFGECQQFKEVTWWPNCPYYAFRDTNGACVFNEPGVLIDTADICARLEAKYGGPPPCDADKDCKSGEICESGECVRRRQ